MVVTVPAVFLLWIASFPEDGDEDEDFVAQNKKEEEKSFFYNGAVGCTLNRVG